MTATLFSKIWLTSATCTLKFSESLSNSKALVTVVESQSGPGSAPALSSLNPTVGAKNHTHGMDRFKQAWGTEGTLIEGLPLANDYNQAVLGDSPPSEEIDRRMETEQFG